MATVRMTKSIKNTKQAYLNRIEDEKLAALNDIGITGKDAEKYIFWLNCHKTVEDDYVMFVHDNYDDLSDVLIFYCGKKPRNDYRYAGFKRVSEKVFDFLKNFDVNELPAKKEYDDWWKSLQLKADTVERKAQHIAEIKLSRDGQITIGEIEDKYFDKYFIEYNHTKITFHKRTGVRTYSSVPEFTLKIKPVDYRNGIFNLKEFEEAMKNKIRTVEVSKELIDYALSLGVTVNANKSGKIEIRYSFDGTNDRWYTSWKAILPADSSNTIIKNAIDEFGSKRAKLIHK